MGIARKKTSPVEIPLTSTSDVAFLLLIFFLVAASNAVDKGTPLDLPQTSRQQQKSESQNIEVGVTKDAITFNGEAMDINGLQDALKLKLAGATEPSLRVVMLTAANDVDYQRWTRVVADIEAAGGIVAPQLEEEDQQQAGGTGGGQ